jgi:hypothetical protein
MYWLKIKQALYQTHQSQRSQGLCEKADWS